MSHGIQTLEYKVLIKPDPVDRKTAGGIYIPEDVATKEEMAQQKGTVVSVGGNAFEDWKDAQLPKVGSRVLFGKYKGTEVQGADEQSYRICNDKDITALLI